MSKVSRKDLQKMPPGELIEKLQDDPEYIAAKLYSEFTDIMYDRMKELNIKRIGLAKRLKKSPSYISQVLNREINPTLFTMMEFLDAVELTMKISYDICRAEQVSKEIDRYEESFELGKIDQNIVKFIDRDVSYNYRPGEKAISLLQIKINKRASDISEDVSEVA